jgi:hypothetical protein
MHMFKRKVSPQTYKKMICHEDAVPSTRDGATHYCIMPSGRQLYLINNKRMEDENDNASD